MIAFIRHNIRTLVSPAYVGAMVVYLAFAWFLADPSFDPTAIYSSDKLTDIYDLMLISIVMMNYVLLIMIHFKQELQEDKRDVLASRLTAGQLFWGVVVSYMLYFLLGFVLPMYGVALVQQLLNAPHNVHLSVFLLKTLTGVFGYTLFWILLTIRCITWFRNEFVALIVVSLLYAGSQLLNLFSHGAWFNQYWLYRSSQSNDLASVWYAGAAWLATIALCLILGHFLKNKILQVELDEPYRKGMLSRIAEFLDADLAMHHYRMMGLSSQKVLAFFTFAGLALLIPLVRRPDANLMPMAKVFLGAFVPVLFSFNQHYLISIDREAGMTHNNFLRKIPYYRIIFNRWILLLAPQLGTQVLFILIVTLFVQSFPLSVVLYILLLSILCSAINLCFAVLTLTNAVANLFLLFFVYLQLRDDIQMVFLSHNALNHLNVFSVLLQSEFQPLELFRWIIVVTLIIIFLLVTFWRLHNVDFTSLDNRVSVWSFSVRDAL